MNIIGIVEDKLETMWRSYYDNGRFKKLIKLPCMMILLLTINVLIKIDRKKRKLIRKIHGSK